MNAAMLDADVEFILADVRDPAVAGKIGRCDAVVMNPPFGAQKVHADRPFIDLALAIAPVTYSIFNAGSAAFVKAYTADRADISEAVSGSFPIKRTFAFHSKEILEIDVEILRMRLKRKQDPAA